MTQIKKDFTGHKQHRIEVIKRVPKPDTVSQSGSYWLCICKCGTQTIAHRTTIIRGLKSCGCVGKEKKYRVKDIRHYRRLYHVWLQLKKRCLKKTNPDYSSYGGRGIRLASNWSDYAGFYNDMVDTYQPGLTIERVDVNGNYCKENCKWIPNKDQAKNRRTTRWVNGMCAKDACKTIDLNYGTFMQRLRSGKSVEQAFY